MTTQYVIAACQSRADVQPFCRLVGQWVWAEFPQKPSADTRHWLKQTGFHWNQQRGAWQHACGVFRHCNRKIDPRLVYGEEAIAGAPSPSRPHHSAIERELSTFQAIGA